jgi:hypothetical protein
MFMKRIAVIVGLSLHYPSMAYLSQRKKGRLCIRIGWCSGLIYQPQGQFQRPFFYFLSYLVNCINKKTAPVTPRETKNPLQKSVIKLLILFYLFSKIFDEKYGDKWPRFKKILSTPPILPLPSIDHQ